MNSGAAFLAALFIQISASQTVNNTSQNGFLLTRTLSGVKLLHIKDVPVSMCLASHKMDPHNHMRTVHLQHHTHGNQTISIQRAHGYHSMIIKTPITETRRVIISEGDRYQGTRRDNHLLFTTVRYPHRTFTVLEPGHPGGCQSDAMYTVMETAKQKNCIVAVNAGFFENTGFFGDHMPCLGNFYSDGRQATDFKGAQSAHFGITKDGYIHVGYLSVNDFERKDFEELIGGAFWIVRDGRVYIDESIDIECPDEHQAETMRLHANTLSARTAVGHDADGIVLIMQADGRTGQTGFTLYEFGKVLLDYGFVQAINLDGGGSATYVVNGILANYPSDPCKNDKRFQCARNVSTVLCVHEPEEFPYGRSQKDETSLIENIFSNVESDKTCHNLSCYDRRETVEKYSPLNKNHSNK